MAKSLLETPWAIAIDPARRDGRIVAESVEAERPRETGRDARPRLTPASSRRCAAAGIERLYSHQREALEAAAALEPDRHQRHRLGQVARLQPAGPRRHRPRSQAPCPLPLPDQGAGPGPGAQARRNCARPGCARRSTTATRRARSARRSAAATTSSSPTPTCSTSGSCPTTRAGATSSPTSAGSWSTRPTPTAASSAPTSPTCCGGCAGWRAPTAREPRFLLASATIANPVELAERLVGTPFELIDDDGAPRAEREIAMWNPPLIDKASGTRRSALSEAAELLADLVVAGVRTICFLKSRRGIELIQRFARDNLAARGKPELAERIAPYRGGYTPAAAARDRGAPARPASCWRWSRPTRWSWGSTSASWTRRSASPSPARSPACARCGAGPGRRRRGLAVYVAGAGRARPVLLPPPRRVPGAAGRGGDPRPRQRADRLAPPGRGGLRAAADRRRRRGLRAGLAGAGGAAGERRGAAPRRRAAAAAQQRVRRLEDPAALGLGRLGRGDRARLGRDARPGRGGARLHDDPPGRDLPPPRPLIRGRAARRRRPPRDRLPLRRRLVHAAEEGDRDLHRAHPRAAGDLRGRAALRRGLGHRAGDRLPAGLDLRPGADRRGRAGAARAEFRHPGALVRAAASG